MINFNGYTGEQMLTMLHKMWMTPELATAWHSHTVKLMTSPTEIIFGWTVGGMTDEIEDDDDYPSSVICLKAELMMEAADLELQKF